MASQRLIPFLLAGGVGVAGAYYIVLGPPQPELTGMTPVTEAAKDGRGQHVKDGRHADGSPSSQPHPSLKSGGASPVDPTKPTIAGTSSDSRKGYSIDHAVSTRANPNVQDGTAGGGVGVAEMRERKMQGQGLPSPQGGDTKAKPVDAVKSDGEGGGIKQKPNGRWWLGGW